jgi:hypothetical protein
MDQVSTSKLRPFAVSNNTSGATKFGVPQIAFFGTLDKRSEAGGSGQILVLAMGEMKMGLGIPVLLRKTESQ